MKKKQFLLPPNWDIHVGEVHLCVCQVKQQGNHFHDGYVPWLSKHRQFVPPVEKENSIDLDGVDVEMFACPDRVVY